MATRIQRIENSLLNKVYVKSEKALKEMVDDGQLQRLSEYYTPDSDTEMPAMPVGSIFISAIPITDARVHLLDGSTIAQDGIYANFANLIKALHSAGNSITCTQTEFDADVTATGNCGKFVIDNDAGTIRLPKITTFIQGLSNIADIGKSLSAGLPNIEGAIGLHGADGKGVLQSFTGAFRGLTPTSTYGLMSAGSGASGYAGTSFNASNSNSIYGNSTTVQPNATQYPYYIVLASGYKSSQVIAIDNIMNEVNSKTTLLEAYPVGSIYMSTNSISPAQRFGGTWERLKDRFLLGAGDNYTEIYKDNGDGTYSGVGGSEKVTLTVSQIPSHNHSRVIVNNTGLSCGVGSGVNGFLRLTSTTSSSSINSELHTGYEGGGQAHENMPPYATVYMWQRVE